MIHFLRVGEPRSVIAGVRVEEARFSDLGTVDVREDGEIDDERSEGHAVDSDVSREGFELS